MLKPGIALSVLLPVAAVLIFSVHVSLARPVGIYGVNQDHPELANYHIDTVFVQPNREFVNLQIAAGREVFLTLNAFGGTQAWKDFPDLIPVMSDGQKLTGQYGGVCPTHTAWRENRLTLLADRVKDFAAENGISGVWLDFLRYPGKWEQPDPEILDSCYCTRCLSLFQVETGVVIPEELADIKGKSSWIRQHVPLQWMEWKKKTIVSFAREVRRVLDQNREKKRLVLGVFLVPWKKSDFDGALSFQLAQDAEQLGAYVDVFSPMVYHRMVGESVGWVGNISRYFKEMTGGQVWPIVQVEDIPAEELERTVTAAAAAGAERLLVYNYSAMRPEHWEPLGLFSPARNLISNPAFDLEADIHTTDKNSLVTNVPLNWLAGEEGVIRDTQFLVKSFGDRELRSVGITDGKDRQGSLGTVLPGCEPGEKYRFSAEFYREDLEDGSAYPEVSIWGKTYRLDTHRISGNFQKLHVAIDCPETVSEQQKHFQFKNSYPSTTFWMRNPILRKVNRNQATLDVSSDDGFFPVGVYGGSSDNLGQIRSIGLNTAVVRFEEKDVAACIEADMHCTLSVPKEPEKLIVALNNLEELLQEGNFSFYVNDEPGIHSFPVWKAEDIQRILKSRYPGRFTNMAIVRPQVVSDYQQSADFFMLDQYPIPYMPVTWLSDSMDEAAVVVGPNRLQSVIQAFGGGRFADSGWPRLPTFAEMNNLAFLSVIHGSRGLYFYSWPEITSTQQGRDDFEKVVRQLNSLRSWLQQKNDSEPVALEMVSRYRFDPTGKPAVHCAAKTLHDTKMLLCANTLGTYTEAEILIPGDGPAEWQEYYSGEQFYTLDNSVRMSFSPLEVKVLMETKL